MVRGSLVFLDTFLHSLESFTDTEVSEYEARDSTENKGKEEQECLGHFNAGKEDPIAFHLSVRGERGARVSTRRTQMVRFAMAEPRGSSRSNG